MSAQQQEKAAAAVAQSKPTVDPARNEKIVNLKAFIEKNLPAASTFRPFARDPDKQYRFDAYNVLAKAGRLDEFRLLHPDGMTEWEMEREKVQTAFLRLLQALQFVFA